MGRTLPTATMRVYQFEGTWKQLARAPRKVDREAFAELVAFAHFHAASIAHAASPYVFEIIVLTMLVGLVRRAETLKAAGVLQFYDPPNPDPESIPLFQTTVRAVMLELRQRLASQKRELYVLARALRAEDQRALRTLLAITPLDNALVPQRARGFSNESILQLLVKTMRRIRQLEKQYLEGRPGATADAWSSACTIR
jgi:hypothetical protein